MQILLVERDDVRGLWPFSATHCAWELRAGYFTSLERWIRVSAPHPVVVHSERPLVEAAFLERYGSACSPLSTGPTLVLDAHAILSVTSMQALLERCGASAEPFTIRCGDNAVGAMIRIDEATHVAVQQALDSLAPETPSIQVDGTLVADLWQVHDIMASMIVDDAALLSSRVHPSASVHPSAVIDETQGPVIIAEGAVIQPMSVIYGPAAIGPHSLVKSHSTLRNVVLGPVCKVAGEIDTVVFHAYASKQHDGFVGHSYLCEWTNLGAGTITSNLLNTYGDIIVHTPWGRRHTNKMFLGVLMGEHTKTAIGTLLMTGTCAGICANVVTSTYPPNLIPSFMWKDPSSNRTPLAKSLSIATRVMERRSQKLGPAMQALLTAIHGNADV